MSKHTTLIEKIQRMYDPENDTALMGPPVTYVEISLLEIIEDLLDRVEDLEFTELINQNIDKGDY